MMFVSLIIVELQSLELNIFFRLDIPYDPISKANLQSFFGLRYLTAETSDKYRKEIISSAHGTSAHISDQNFGEIPETKKLYGNIFD
jgi:hypothetical protein